MHHLHVHSSLLLDDDDVLAVTSRGTAVDGLLLVTTWGSISRGTIRGRCSVNGGRGV